MSRRSTSTSSIRRSADEANEVAAAAAMRDDKRHSSSVNANADAASEAPPSYAASSSNRGTRAGGSSNGAGSSSATHSNADGDDPRPLPQGWVKQWDGTHSRWYYVDTRASPPRSIWVHPFDDPQFKKANPHVNTSFAPPSGPPPASTEQQRQQMDAGGISALPFDRNNPPPEIAARIKKAGDDAADKARSKPEPSGIKKLARNLKDNSSHSDYVQRQRIKAENIELQKIHDEQRRKTHRAFIQAAQFGAAQYLGRDHRSGTEYYAEPPAPGLPIHFANSYPPPYGFETRRDGNRVYMRPAAPTVGYGYNGYGYGSGMGMGMPLMGGMMGGLLLGSVLF